MRAILGGKRLGARSTRGARLTSVWAASTALWLSIGCGSDAAGPDEREGPGGGGQRAASITLQLSTTAVSVTQGQATTVIAQVTRTEFNGAVSIQVSSPAGLTVTPSPGTIVPNTSSLDLLVDGRSYARSRDVPRNN